MISKKIGLLLELAKKSGVAIGTTEVSREEAISGESLNPGYDIISNEGAATYVKYNIDEISLCEADLLKISALETAKNIKTIKACTVFFAVVTAISMAAGLLIALISLA